MLNLVYLWQFWIIFLFIIVFILWLLYGGEENLEYIGLSPLKIGVNAADYIRRDEDKQGKQTQTQRTHAEDLDDISSEYEYQITKTDSQINDDTSETVEDDLNEIYESCEVKNFS